MPEICLETPETIMKLEPVCPVFRQCGGCKFQDITYEDELAIKSQAMGELFQKELGASSHLISEVVPSPDIYHYRNRLDLGLYRFASGSMTMGFRNPNSRKTIPVETCAIARKEISDYLPQLKQEAMAKMPEKYRMANLVVRTDDSGQIAWGGIGRHSLEMNEKDYFWTELNRKKIFYSLDTFFQANLSILPALIETLEDFKILSEDVTFLDLYSGVGLFGISLADAVGEVMMIEESISSVKIAKHNAKYHNLEEKMSFYESKVEVVLSEALEKSRFEKIVAMIDPPRKGLEPQVIDALSQAAFRNVTAKKLKNLFYLSCSPKSLVRDLKLFVKDGWRMERVIPFDFFPRTEHLETLVWLTANTD